MTRRSGRARIVLAIDVGGTHVKVLATGRKEPRKARSGTTMTARLMVTTVKRLTSDWPYDVVSIGYPGPVLHGRIVTEPRNLGGGWVRFDFARAFARPVKIVNDAVMQALGSYRRGRMLFLGLGTGLGTALIVDGVIEPMELAHLPYRKGRTYEDYLGQRGLERLGRRKWQKHVVAVARSLKAALEAEDVVIGGGNARLLHPFPRGFRQGSNAHAFTGGFRLWAPARKRARG